MKELDTTNYTYLIVPIEYKYVYLKILDTLGQLGTDLLSSCTSACKGRSIHGVVCYNMFNAACCAYYLGDYKRAHVLISYIKAELNIEYDDEDSEEDEYIYLEIPNSPYDAVCTFNNLVPRMVLWGQELLDDCGATCKSKNRHIFNAWNLFIGGLTAIESERESDALKIFNYIKTLYNFTCVEGYKAPVISNFIVTDYKFTEENKLQVNKISFDITNVKNVKDGKIYLLDTLVGYTLEVGDLNEIEDIHNVSVDWLSSVNFGTFVKGVPMKLKVFDIRETEVYSDEYLVPYIPFQNPEIHNFELVNTGYDEDNSSLVADGFSCHISNAENLDRLRLVCIDYGVQFEIDNLPVTEDQLLDISLSAEYEKTYHFVLEGIKGTKIYTSNIYSYTTPVTPPYAVPDLTLYRIFCNPINNYIDEFVLNINYANIANAVPNSLAVNRVKINEDGSITKLETLDDGFALTNVVNAGYDFHLTEDTTFTLQVVIEDTQGNKHSSINSITVPYEEPVQDTIRCYYGYATPDIDFVASLESYGTIVDVNVNNKQFVTETPVEDYKCFWFALPQGYSPQSCINQQFVADDIIDMLQTKSIQDEDGNNYTIYYYQMIRLADNTYKVTFGNA